MNNEPGMVMVRQGTALPSRSQWQFMLEMAQALLSSGLLPNTIKSPQAAVALLMKGSELGIPPMQALSQIVVVNGKPSLQSELMAALIYRDQGDDALQFTKTTAAACTISYKRRGWTERREFSFSMEDAQRAGLTTNTTWTKYPAAMLRARCISAVARMAFPDSIGGMHSPEELGAAVTVRDGEIVMLDQQPAQRALAAPDPVVDEAEVQEWRDSIESYRAADGPAIVAMEKKLGRSVAQWTLDECQKADAYLADRAEKRAVEHENDAVEPTSQQEYAEALELARLAVQAVQAKPGGPTLPDQDELRHLLVQLQRLQPREGETPAAKVNNRDLLSVIAGHLPVAAEQGEQPVMGVLT